LKYTHKCLLGFWYLNEQDGGLCFRTKQGPRYPDKKKSYLLIHILEQLSSNLFHFKGLGIQTGVLVSKQGSWYPNRKVVKNKKFKQGLKASIWIAQKPTQNCLANPEAEKSRFSIFLQLFDPRGLILRLGVWVSKRGSKSCLKTKKLIQDFVGLIMENSKSCVEPVWLAQKLRKSHFYIFGRFFISGVSVSDQSRIPRPQCTL
jgi:hypothetical protein